MRSVFGILGWVLLLGVGCSGNATPAAHSADQTPPGASAAPPSAQQEATRTSSRFGYSWTLPAGWEFVDVPPSAAATATETVTARQPDGPVASMVVTDLVEVVAGKHAGDDPKRVSNLARFGTQMLQQLGATEVRTKRTRMFDTDAMQVEGKVEPARIAIRLLYRDSRWFQFRCTDLSEHTEWRCDEAFAQFQIQDRPEPAPDVPQVRHLRDARFGIEFDAPDDTWLSVGPRTGGGGAQVVWIWSKEGRQQIDVQAMDLSAFGSGRKPTQKTFIDGWVSNTPDSQGFVVEKQDEVSFAGHVWSHAALRSPKSGVRDVFVLVLGETSYAILVSSEHRDQRLLDAAQAGFRLKRK